MASTYLNRAFSSGSVGTIATWSFWIKRSLIGSAQFIFQTRDANNNNYRNYFRFGSTDTFDMFAYNSSGTQILDLRTNRVFRDTSAWYHIVIAMNTTISATPSDRIKFYVNGVQETSFGTATYPTHNLDIRKVSSVYTGWGQNIPNNSSFVDGSMSHINFIDGTAYDATAFGSTDSTTGEWQITANPSVTYGTNGYFILKDGNTITDSSPNSNNFSLGGGTLTKTEDNPSNVFCTMNPLVNVPDIGFSEGNTKITNNNNGRHFTNYGTLGFSTGKYYWEAEASVPLSSKWTIGLSDVKNQSAYQQTTAASVIVGNTAASYVAGDAIGWYYSTLYKNGSTIASGLSTIASGDRMMIACDADNGKIYFGKNGTWRVANSTTFDAAQNDTTFTTGESYTPAFSNEYCGWKINFGNGYFGTTAVSSAGTNASNNGIFEYDVPTGYTALSTKGLNL